MVHSNMYTLIGVNLQLDGAENLIFYTQECVKKIVYIVVTFERKERTTFFFGSVFINNSVSFYA